MGFIPEDKVNQIIESSDIVAIIGEYVNLKKSGSSYKGLCPFHNEKTPSFTVDEKKQLFHCFGCGAGGNVVSFIMQKEGLSYPEALKFLADKSGIKISYSQDKTKKESLNRFYDINRDIMMYFYKNLLTDRKAQNYLKERDLKSSIVNTFMLGYAKNSWDDLLKYVTEKDYLLEDIEKLGLIKKSDKGTYYDKYRDRLIFPIINHYGKIIGFGGRAISGQMPKYLNSPESEVFKKRYNLYGLNVFKKQNKRDIILVEGYMDVIGLNNRGVDLAVASLGTAFTHEQAKLLKRYADNIYICYDSDTAGIKATDRAIEILLEEDIYPKIISLEDGLDPDDFIKKYGKDLFLKKMDQAYDVYNYKYNKLLDLYSNSRDNEKLEKLDLFVEFIASIKSDLTKDIFINNVHNLFNIDKQTLKDAVVRYNQKHRQNDEKVGYKNNIHNENRIIVKEKNTNISPNELETLRLFYNQRDKYDLDKEFFDQVLKNEKVLALKEYLETNKIDKDIYDKFSEDFYYIIEYINNNRNKIVVEELKDRIELENRKKLLKKLKSKSGHSMLGGD
ncbi:MAG: DNA primase [Peptoniphilaceae bacterium]|nr:DNA primase [Peptoniphilaceae bacterium]MDY6019133.1 DNA primase [Anaerococcus sp.]